MTPEKYNQAKRTFEGIRDERGRYQNTATRIGNAFLLLLDILWDSLSTGGEKYVTLDGDQEISGVKGFLKGMWVGIRNRWYWDENGNLHAGSITVENRVTSPRVDTDEVRSSNYTGDTVTDTGYLLSNNISGRSKLIIDEIYVRVKAVFESLEVKKWSVVAGDEIRSCASNTINIVEYFDGYGNLMGYSYTRIPWLLKGVPFLISHFSKGLGRKMYATVRKVRMTLTEEQLNEVRICRCYFLAKDNDREVENWWKADEEYGHDYARCQTMNLKNTTRETFTSVTRKAGNVFWWRKVVGMSTTPVQLQKKKYYHFINVAYNRLEELAGPTTFCAEGSDIPAAGDEVVQFGNDINPGRMNVILNQVNGGGRYDYDTSDAPCTKYYKGIYTFDLTKCWFGGDPCKCVLAPGKKFRFAGEMFEFIQEYGTKKVEIQRGAWTDIPLEDDDYGRTIEYSDDDKTNKAPGKVRKCYYYDSVSHKGCQWLCSIVDGAHWVDENGHYISDAAYSALADSEKVKCSRKQNYTIKEPTTGDPDWTKIVDRGTSVKTVTTSYAKSSQGTTPPETGWVTLKNISTLNLKNGDYLWTRVVTEYSDTLEPTVSYSVSRWGVDGDGIASINSFYYGTQSTSPINKNTDTGLTWYDTYAELLAAHGGVGSMQGWYIWEKTVIKYDSYNDDGTPRIRPDVVSYRVTRLGTDGLLGQEEYYMLASSNDFKTVFGSLTPDYAHIGIRWYNQNAPATENFRLSNTTPVINLQMWSPYMPTYDKDVHGDKVYLWNFEQRVDGTGTEYATRPICIGNHARGIIGIIELYALSAAGTPQSGHHVPDDIWAANNNSETDSSKSDPTKPNTWTDERYDRAPTEQYPYQWNWTRVLYSDGGHEDHWHVSAVRGTNGEDGAGVEYVYFRNNTGTAPSAPSNPQDRSVDDYVPSGWTDNPQGVDYTHQYEFESKRVLGAPDSYGRRQWGNFQTPSLRSRWGRNGVDGDGIEYVFIRTKTYSAPTITNSEDTYASKTYIDDDYLPLSSAGRCTDDPAGVDSEYKFEWCAIRRKTAPNAETGERTWEKYSGTMLLWHNFAESILKVSETYRYATNNTGIRPAANSNVWSTTRPTLDKGYWLFTEITILWSDGSTTVLYTDERNPNDGVTGQDIIVDGSTEIKYAVTSSNTSHPAEGSSDWKDLSQLTQTPGKWLWSKATTYYRKSNSAAGAHDAGYSVNYNVSYIPKDGTAGRGITSVTEYYKATNSSAAMEVPSSDSGWSTDPNLSDLTNKWGETYKYLWNYEKVTYSSGTTVERTKPQILAIWSKDGAPGRGIDSITNYYKVTANANPPLRMHEGGSGWDDDPVIPTADNPYLWNYEVITWINPSSTSYTDVQPIGHFGKDGSQGPPGPTGPTGKDGWMITADPAVVIITQGLGSNLNTFTTGSVGFTAKKGNVSATVSSIGTPSSSTFNVSKSGNKVNVTSPKTSGGSYITEGSFEVAVYVTDPDSGVTVTFNVTVPCYANLLGTWKQTVENGMESIIAQKVTYSFLNGVLTKDDRTFDSLRSAIIANETWKRQKEETYNGYAQQITNTNNRVNTAEQAIQRLSANTKNILDCSGGDGWREYTGDELSVFDGSLQKVNSSDAYSTAVLLEAGVTYVFSVYANSKPSVIFGDCYGNPNSLSDDIQWENTLSVNTNTEDKYQGYNRYWCTFTPSYTEYYKINVYSVSMFYRPQLERGSEPTTWVPGGRNQSTEIKQTASEISLTAQTTIEGKLKNTGVRIDGSNRYIELKGDKVKFSDSDGGNQDKIWIDPKDGTLHAVNGVFTGSLLFHKVLTSSLYISENGCPLFKMYDTDGYEIPLNNRTKVVTEIKMECDTFLLTGAMRDYTIWLPPAKLFPGAQIEIINGTYSGGSGNAVSLNLSRITLSVFYPYNINSQIKETFNEQDGSYVSNAIISGIPFKYRGFTGSGYGDMTFTGVFESNRAIIEDYGSWIEGCGIVCGHASLNYKRIRLISTQNNFLSTKSYYAWMIVEANE